MKARAPPWDRMAVDGLGCRSLAGQNDRLSICAGSSSIRKKPGLLAFSFGSNSIAKNEATGVCSGKSTGRVHVVSCHFTPMDTKQTIRKRRRPASATVVSASATSASPNGIGTVAACDRVGQSAGQAPPPHQNATPANTDNNNTTKRRYAPFDYVIISITLALALATTSFVIYGFILRASFHHGQECDMTYSRYKFLPIEVANYTAGARPYRLLKFVDARDPRNIHLWKEDDNFGAKQTDPHGDGTKVLRLSDNWCLLPRSNYTSDNGISTKAPYPNPGHPVLFIPGHWGEYKQARSLGAHGTTFTRRSHSYKYQNDVVRGLMDGTLNRRGGDDGDINHFIYDVYTADFDGEGAGLHGSRMVRQAYFVAQSILTIARACNADQIIIVGHSIGGIVAKAVPLLSPEAGQYIKTIITLASPHNGFPYAFDSSVGKFYNYVDEGNLKSIEEGKEFPIIVSISGGLRDELIPPSTCGVDPSLGLSMLATDVMSASIAEGVIADVSLGCDHKAISWCHNVLSVVRTIIFATVEVGSLTDTAKTRIAHLRKRTKLEVEDYADALEAEERSFSDTHGFGKAAALQTTMPYRAWECVLLYFIVATIQTLHSIISGKIDFLRTCKYTVVLPIPLSFIFVRLVPFPWSTFVTTTALSTGSCLLYAIILHGILPLLSGLCVYFCGGKEKVIQSKYMPSKESRWANHIFTTFITSLTTAAASMHLYHAAKGHQTVLNGLAVRAVLYWTLIFSILSGLVWSSVKRSNKVVKVMSALFLPILPFVVAGKLVYNLSLVSVGGQLEDGIFMNYQQR